MSMILRVSVAASVVFGHASNVSGKEPEAAQQCAQQTRAANLNKLALRFSPGGYLKDGLAATGTAVGIAAGTGLASALTPGSSHPQFKEMLAYIGKQYTNFDRAIHNQNEMITLKREISRQSKYVDPNEVAVRPEESKVEYKRRMTELGSKATDTQLDSSYDRQGKLTFEYKEIHADRRSLTESDVGRRFEPIMRKIGLGPAQSYYFEWATESAGRQVAADRARRQDDYLVRKLGPGAFGTHPARAPLKATLGVIGGVGGMALGTGVDHLLVQKQCEFKSLGSGNKLAAIFDASLNEGCRLSNEGSLALAKLEDGELLELCKASPNLSQVVNQQLKREMDAMTKMPKPKSVDFDCKGNSLAINVDDRKYNFEIRNDGGPVFLIKGKATGKVTKEVDFSGHFDPKTLNFAMDDERDGVREDTLADVYSARKGSQQGDPIKDRHSTLGEGLSLVRAFAPTFVAGCAAESPVSQSNGSHGNGAAAK